MIWADVYRRNGSATVLGLLKLLLLERTFRPVFTMRLYQGLPRSAPMAPLRLAALLLHRFICDRAGLDLPAKTPVGPGLDISHGWGVVVSGEAVLGSNVTLFHGATVGQGDRIAPDGSRTTRHPVLEDDVWIGPHACVLGGVVIGTGSRIMPGAVVTVDIPARSMVAGNPARVVQTDCTVDIRNRAPVPRRPAA